MITKEKIVGYNRTKLLNRYGITPDIYDSYLEDQHGRCAICSIHQSELEKKIIYRL